MSEEKFTPGEWTAHHGIMEPTYIFIGKEDAYVDGETPVICELYHGIRKKSLCAGIMDFDHTEIRANAALIAAAPEMYWMLEELKDDLKALSINPNVSEQVKASAWLDIQHIERVQKKARGGE